MAKIEKIFRELRRLHADETGPPQADIVIIIALIGIPLILLLIFFGKHIAEFLQQKYKELMQNKDTVPSQL